MGFRAVCWEMFERRHGASRLSWIENMRSRGAALLVAGSVLLEYPLRGSH